MFSKSNKWFLLILLSLVWGSSFILIKKGLIGLNPYQLGALRIIFASLFMILVGVKTVLKIPLFKWKYIFLASIFGTAIPVFLFSYAQTGIKSSVSAILNSLTPLYTLLIGLIFFGLSVLRNQMIGIIIGLVGCLLLVMTAKFSDGGTHLFHVSLVVIATLCYAINVNLIKKYLSDISPIAITTGSFLFLVLPAIFVLFYNGYGLIMSQTIVIHSTLFIVILGIVGTGIANVLYYQLIHITSPLFASSVTYFIPVVAMFWGIIDGETLTIFQIIGAFIILGGVYLASKK